MPTDTLTDLTTNELETIAEALDSHLYWQVNDDTTRRASGYIMEPYTPAEQEVIDLEAKVQKIISERKGD